MDVEGTYSQPFRFTGEMRDENGLQYNRSRYFSPNEGLFTKLDSFEGQLQRPMSLNGYSWVQGNVANLVDPNGEDAFPECEDLLTRHFNMTPDNAASRCETHTSYVATPIDRLERYPFLWERPDVPGNFDFNAGRRTAINYAIQWSQAAITNPEYPNLVDMYGNGTNCTNFVSQTLAAAGYLPDDLWNPGKGYPLEFPPASGIPVMEQGCGGIFPGSTGCPSAAWGSTRDLVGTLFWKGWIWTVITGGVSYPRTLPQTFDYLHSKDAVRGGDIAFFYQGDPLNWPNHDGIIIGWGPPVDQNGNLDFNSEYIPWFADNTGARYMRPLNDLGQPSSHVLVIHVPYE